ncbi:MAG: heavy metal translocating P-type ATPase metal-binding domain-containing protein [Flavobacteriaceae bacterium]|nr:heavy metal translocating P-type ATPase metal-binding domain-containing protein [Flavobacteriaceae bacterium]
MENENCFHCGLETKDTQYVIEDKLFCCNGCKTVFEILNQHELNCYYDFERSPGVIPKELKNKYNYLDSSEIVEKILDFYDGQTCVVEFYIPSIHCSSCIWVLENLDRFNAGVKNSLVNFPQKTLRVTYKESEISLKQLVEFIASIGYEPQISLEDSVGVKKTVSNALIYKISIAAFVFGNIMLLSFPEYFEIQEFWLERYKNVFRYLNFVMILPVVFYSATDYYISAYKGLKNRMLNIDVPITLGVIALYLRSVYEIVFDVGAGYFDSLAGLIFFLLLGKIFQQKTYNYLSFERDFKSYFPIAVTAITKDGKEISKQIQHLKLGDRILIRNEELVPVDGIMINGEATLDYSFVTGESYPIKKESGEKIFAGGKQLSGLFEMEVIHEVSQSYLTQLWSSDIFQKDTHKSIKTHIDKVSKYFTIVVLTIAFSAAIYWYFTDVSKAVYVFTAVLIITCPCALALTSPFALGNILRIFGKNRFYLKNAQVIEALTKINTIIFDKTGTITTNQQKAVNTENIELNVDEKRVLKTLLRNSNHPLSRIVYESVKEPILEDKITAYNELTGLGIEGKINDFNLRVGSSKFLGLNQHEPNETRVYVEINNQLKGYYSMKNTYRQGIEQLFLNLYPKYELIILSGDNEGEKERLLQMLPPNTQLEFDKKPIDKLNFVRELQDNGKRVLMIGDGLNDAGALAQSNVGIAVSDDVNVFTPASDGIIDAKIINKIPQLLNISHQTLTIIKTSFVFSFLYNVVGLYFAVTGQLTPLIAAILMPLSSITIVIYVTFLTNFISRKQ